ncbi:MAG: NAD(P)-dependent oxidoreductase [Anaerolineae bacterium]
MRIFFAGATGAVGRLLLPKLLEAGHSVVAITRSSERAAQLRAAGAEPAVVDVLDAAAVLAAVEQARPTLIMHQLTDLSARDFAANSHLRVEGTRNLVDAALAVGAQRMVAQSLYSVYGPGDSPAREDEPLDMQTPSRGQLIAGVQSLEQAVARMPVGVALRYGYFYGPGTWYARDGLTTEQIRRGEITATDAEVSFVHVADAAEAAFQALNWPAGVVNVADDEPAPGTEWVPLYASLVGAPTPPVKLGRQPWERGASNAKARALGWVPAHPTWRDGFVQEFSGD